MSRSYKKYPCVKDRSPFGKKVANGIVRRTKDVPDGKSYKKLYDSWNISDYSFHKTWTNYFDNEVKKFLGGENYCAHFRFHGESSDHWSKKDPRLVEEKHRGLYRQIYLNK